MRIMAENGRENKTGFPLFSYIFLIEAKKESRRSSGGTQNRENYSMNRTATALPSTRTMRVSSSPPMSMGE